MKIFNFSFFSAFLFLIFFGCITHSNAQSLSFSQVLLVSGTPLTIPVGKVWKVENVYVGKVPKFQANSGSGGCSGSCNGSSTTWTTFTISDCPTLNAVPYLRIDGLAVEFLQGSPLWLPAGTQVQGNQYNCNSSAGFFTGQGYTCNCPANPTVYSTVSIIEFNVVPWNEIPFLQVQKVGVRVPEWVLRGGLFQQVQKVGVRVPEWVLRGRPASYLTLPLSPTLLCAPDGNRTRTAVSGNRILSPARLPVPPPGQFPKET